MSILFSPNGRRTRRIVKQSKLTKRRPFANSPLDLPINDDVDLTLVNNEETGRFVILTEDATVCLDFTVKHIPNDNVVLCLVKILKEKIALQRLDYQFDTF
jgi:hypothetical protein